MFPADNVDTIISEPEVEKHPIISIQIESKDQLTNQHLNDLERDINELQQESTDKVEDEQSLKWGSTFKVSKRHDSVPP